MDTFIWLLFLASGAAYVAHAMFIHPFVRTAVFRQASERVRICLGVCVIPSGTMIILQLNGLDAASSVILSAAVTYATLPRVPAP